MILAYDVLTHNYDRLPFIWDNRGNLENIMFDVAGEPYAIDSVVSCFDPTAAPDSFAVYKDRVREVVYHVHNSIDGENEAFNKLRSLFLHGSGTMADENFTPPFCYDIGAAGLLAIKKGFLEASPKVAFLGRKVLQALHDHLENDVSEHVTERHSFGLDRINIGFLVEVSAIFGDGGKQPDQPAHTATPTDTLRRTKYQVFNWGSRANVGVVLDGKTQTLVGRAARVREARGALKRHATHATNTR